MFAWKELKAQKVMAVLILVAVVLSGTMTTVIGQSLGILQAMRIKQAASLNGDRYATFYQLAYEQMTELADDPRLSEVGSLVNVGNTELGNSGLTLFLREYLGDALNAYQDIQKVKEGRLPAAPLEIALPENALPYLDGEIQVGDTVTLRAKVSLMQGTVPPYEYTADFTVCGILEGSYIGYVSGVLTAVAGAGTADALLPEEYLLYATDFKTRSTAQFQEIVDDLADRLAVEKSMVQYNWILLDALGIFYEEAGASDTGTGFSFMTFACVMVGVLVLLAAGLVIYNILKIAVTKRMKEYGILRAIGGERGQIYRIVFLQLLILCGIGMPIGLLAGGLSAKGILMAATEILNPDLFLADSAGELHAAIRAADSNHMLCYLASIAVTLGFAMLAAFPAVRYAARVSPTAAMTGLRVKVKRRGRKVKKIRNFEAWYAGQNLRRGRGRTVITILSLVMSITVFVTLQSFIKLLDTGNEVKNMNTGDYAVTNENPGMDPQVIEEIRENEWVESLAFTKLSTYTRDEKGEIPVNLDFPMQLWEAFHIACIEDARLMSYGGGVSKEDMEDVRNGKACLVKNPIGFSYEGQEVETTNLAYNDVIAVNGHKLRVAGVVDAVVTINNRGFENGVQIMVNEEIYRLLTGSDRYLEVYPVLKRDADIGQFETWLDGWCRENPGSHWLSYQQTKEQLEESFAQIHMLCWGLILFIGLIGILNIINTVYSNIHTRIAEIGMQRAIGMSAGSLSRTFLWEGAYYGIIASIAGGLLGYICTVFVNAAMTDALQFVAVPYPVIFEAAVISVISCLTATAVPLRAVAGMDVVEAIEGGE